MATILSKMYADLGLKGEYGEDFEPYVRLLPDVVSDLMEQAAAAGEGKLLKRGLVGVAAVAGFATLPLAGVAVTLFGVMMEGDSHKTQREHEQALDQALAEAHFCERYGDNLAELLNATAAVFGWTTMWTSYEATLRHIICEDDDRLTGKAYENAMVEYCTTVVEGTEMFLRKVKYGVPNNLWVIALEEMQNERQGRPYRIYEQIKRDEATLYLNTHRIEATPIQAELVAASERPALPSQSVRPPSLYSGGRSVEVLGLPAAVPPKAPQLPPATSPIITPPPAAPAAPVAAVDAGARAEIERIKAETEQIRAQIELTRLQTEAAKHQQAPAPAAPVEPTPAPAPALTPAPIITPASIAPPVVEETAAGFPDLGMRPNVAPHPPATWTPDFGIKGSPLPHPLQPVMGDFGGGGGGCSGGMIDELAELLEEPTPDPVDCLAMLGNAVVSGAQGAGKSTLTDSAIARFKMLNPGAWVGVLDGKSEGGYQSADAKYSTASAEYLRKLDRSREDLAELQSKEVWERVISQIPHDERPKLLVIDEPDLIYPALTKEMAERVKAISNNISHNAGSNLSVWIVSVYQNPAQLRLHSSILAQYKKVFVAQGFNRSEVQHAKTNGFVFELLPQQAQQFPHNRYVSIAPGRAKLETWLPIPVLQSTTDPARRRSSMFEAAQLAEQDALDKARKEQQAAQAAELEQLKVMMQTLLQQQQSTPPAAPVTSAPNPQPTTLPPASTGRAALLPVMPSPEAVELEAAVDALMDWIEESGITTFTRSIARNKAPRSAGGRDSDKIQKVLDAAVADQLLTFDGTNYTRE